MDVLPVIALLNFAKGLPATIRDVVLARCCLGFDDTFDPKPDDDYFELFRVRLQSGDVVDITYATAKMIGLMELALERDETIDLKETGRRAFEKTGSQIFARMALGDPLKDRHWDAAHAEFHELRRGALSPKALGRMMSMANELFLQRFRGAADPAG